MRHDVTLGTLCSGVRQYAMVDSHDERLDEYNHDYAHPVNRRMTPQQRSMNNLA